MAMNYMGAKYLFSKARYKWEGKTMSMLNTRLVVSSLSPNTARNWDKEGTVFALRYHRTEIVRWFSDGRIASSFNGWDTITTRRRIREYSPVNIGTSNGCIHAWNNGKLWSGDAYTWFFTNDAGEICFDDGVPVPDVHSVRHARPIPKSRNPLTQPLLGDAFRDPKGKKWVCVAFESQNVLLPYLGDLPDDPRHIARGPGNHMGLTPLELLTMAAPGWETIPRFPWTRNPQQQKQKKETV